MVLQRFKVKIQPKGRNQRNIYKSGLSHFRQTLETVTEFWTELKRKFELAKGTTNIQCEEHRNCQDCHQRYVDDELMSYIYIEVREQKVRDLIDQLPDEQHTLDKYVEIGELQETSKANGQAFHSINGHSTVINVISRQYRNNFKCKRCSKNPQGSMHSKKASLLQLWKGRTYS